MKRRIRRIRRALKRAGLYNAFHITLIAVLLTGFCVILFNVKEPEQQEKVKRYDGHKVGYVDGMAASIASVIMFACDELHFATGAQAMIRAVINRK